MIRVRSVLFGICGGIFWGWVCMAINSVTGVFAFEGSFLHDLVTFSAGGAIFGLLAAVILSVAGGLMPFRRVMFKAVFTTVALWVVIRALGAALSAMSPGRYNMITPQIVQGLVLAALLGVILGAFWKQNHLAAQSSGVE